MCKVVFSYTKNNKMYARHTQCLKLLFIAMLTLNYDVSSRSVKTVRVTAMLNELGWHSLSKRRKDARLILFYKIINNLAKVPHEHILVKAYEGTRRKNNHKFRHIGVNTSQYRQSFFQKTIGAWNQLPYADSPTLESFRRNLLSTVRP